MAMAALEHLSLTNNEDVNILLLGETGIGKSTFINALVNYLQFGSFKSAFENCESLQCLIPTKFTVIEEDEKKEFNELLIEFGSSDNENSDISESATLTTTSYIFNLADYDINLRVIDTPGIGDTRGINQDNINQQNIIKYLSNYKYLNAVCILLKPNQVRCTIMFQYCINQLLSLLHKTSRDNIIFIFTHTSHSFFTPGEIHSLTKVLKDIEEKENIKIPFSRENVFCIENESFRYLLARKGNMLSEKEDLFSNSWNITQCEYWRMIDYIMTLSPCNIENTLYLYETRKKFNELAQNLINFSDYLKNFINLMTKFQTLIDVEENAELINDAKTNMEEIKKTKSIYETDKDNTIMQITKILSYLQTNAIIVSNDFTEGYINYLIDRENSLGSTSDRRLIRQYHEMTKFCAEIKNIIKMDIHHDPFSPVMTREELSSTFPQLESELKSLINSASKNETEVQLHIIESEECEYESIEQEDSTTYNFDEMFNIIKETGTNLLNHLEKNIEYDDLRQKYVKEQHPLFNENNLNDNYANNAFKNVNSKVSLSNEPDILNNFSKSSNDWCLSSQDGASSTSNAHNKKQRYRRGRGGRFHYRNRTNQDQRQENENRDYPQKSSNSCFLDLLHSNHVESDNFVHIGEEDDFVFIGDFANTSNQNKRYFRGRFRGQGRGSGGRGTRGVKCNQQLHKNFTSANKYKSKCNDSSHAIKNFESHKDSTNKPYNKNQQQSKPKLDSNKNNSNQQLKIHLPYKDNTSKYDLNKSNNKSFHKDSASKHGPSELTNKNQRSNSKFDKDTLNKLPKNRQLLPKDNNLKDNKPQNKNQQTTPKSDSSSKNTSKQSSNKQHNQPNTGLSNRPYRNNNAQQENLPKSFKNIFD